MNIMSYTRHNNTCLQIKTIAIWDAIMYIIYHYMVSLSTRPKCLVCGSRYLTTYRYKRKAILQYACKYMQHAWRQYGPSLSLTCTDVAIRRVICYSALFFIISLSKPFLTWSYNIICIICIIILPLGRFPPRTAVTFRPHDTIYIMYGYLLYHNTHTHTSYYYNIRSSFLSLKYTQAR